MLKLPSSGQFAPLSTGKKRCEKGMFLLWRQVGAPTPSSAKCFDGHCPQTVVAGNHSVDCRDRDPCVPGNFTGSSGVHRSRVNDPPTLTNPGARLLSHPLLDLFERTMKNDSCHSRSHDIGSFLLLVDGWRTCCPAVLAHVASLTPVWSAKGLLLPPTILVSRLSYETSALKGLISKDAGESG